MLVAYMFGYNTWQAKRHALDTQMGSARSSPRCERHGAQAGQKNVVCMGQLYKLETLKMGPRKKMVHLNW